MKIQKISNTSEIYTFTELSKGLEGSDLLIFPKIAIKDVVTQEQKGELKKALRNTLNNSHFDIVVTDKHHIPVFAVEFDGPHHSVYERTIRSDIRKNRICQIAKLPLIRVSDEHLTQYDSISIVQFIAYRHRMWREHYQKILKELTEKFENLADDEYKYFKGEGRFSSDFDPSFQFHLRFPFPKTSEIRTQLAEKYNLNPHPPFQETKEVYWYTVFPGGEGSDLTGTYHYDYTYGLYFGSSEKRLSWDKGNISSSKTKTLLKDRFRVKVKWSLVTAEDYDFMEPPYLYNERHGFMPIYHADIPGAHLPYIADCMCEYFCYKRIQKWVEENLSSGS